MGHFRSALIPAAAALVLSFVSAPVASATDTRARIVALAQSQLGQVQGDRRGADGFKIGWQRLAEYYRVAFGLQALTPAWLQAVKKVGARVAEQPRWGGIFAVWAVHSAGVGQAHWARGAPQGVGGARRDLGNAQPGDILILKGSGSRCLMERRIGADFSTLEGNAQGQTVLRITRRGGEVDHYFRTVAAGSTSPTTGPVGTVGPVGMVGPAIPVAHGADAAIRARIVQSAQSQLGLTKDVRGADGKKFGWQRLVEYYRIAFRIAPLPSSWLRAIQTVGDRVSGTGGWGAFFATWAARTGGVNTVKWGKLGSGGYGPLGVGPARRDFANLRPGDIVVIRDKYAHHCILEKVAGTNVTTLDGNLGQQEVTRQHRQLRDLWYYYRTVQFDGAPYPAPAGSGTTPPSGNPGTTEPSGPAPSTTHSTRMCQAGASVKGIDTSVWQGAIDWSAVRRDGVVYAITKASEGSTLTDKTFARNWKGMRDAGIIRGAYHFFHPGIDPTRQAQHFVAAIRAQGGLLPTDLPPVADVEVLDHNNSAGVQQSLRVFLAEVQRLTGRRPMVYTAAFMSASVGRGFSGYPLWVANFGATCPLVPAGWGRWRFWQWTSTGHVNGIGGRVDVNRFSGTEADLRAFIKGN